MIEPRDRAPFSAIVDRPPLRLPGGARVAIWPMVNLEVWDINKPMARQVLPAPTAQVLLPDVPNWSWHEYGMRVGFWRFHICSPAWASGPPCPSTPVSATTTNVWPPPDATASCS
jgi:hypothetical protein